MTNKIVGYFFVLLVLAQPKLFAASPIVYSIKDLEILEAQKNYDEFLLHARDVVPSKRDKHWTDMVHHMAVSYIQFGVERFDFRDTTQKLIENLSNWSSLRSDEFYQLKRQHYTKMYLDDCYAKKDFLHCYKRTIAYWNTTKKNPEMGHKLAKLLDIHSPVTNLWPFVKAVTTSPYSEFYCNQPLIQKHLFIHLKNSVDNLTDTKKMAQAIDLATHSECWSKFQLSLKRQFFMTEGAKRDLIYSLLKSQGQVSQEDEDLYLSLYLLDNPKTGEIMNLAWNRLKLLGQNFSRRQVLIKRLKAIDPLPDGIFAEKNPRRKEALLSFISLNLPEYMNHYAKTCLSYLEGLKDFVNGNPTIRCNQMFRYSKKKKILSDSLHLRYSATKKF